jgi:hypothetical protein
VDQIIVIEKYDRQAKSWGFLKVEFNPNVAQRWIASRTKPMRYRLRVFVPQQQFASMTGGARISGALSEPRP